MFTLTLFGWMLFRTSSMAWLYRVFFEDARLDLFGPKGMVALYILTMLLIYCISLLALALLDRYAQKIPIAQPLFCALAIVAIVVFCRGSQQDFIYFQF